jgi:predicted ATPase
MAITLEAKNFRVLRRTLWHPSPVSVVVGPNGSGKTTLLSLFEFFRFAYQRGLAAAIDFQGGAWGLRHVLAAPDDSVEVGVTVGNLTWMFQLSIRGASVDPRPAERVLQTVPGQPPQVLLDHGALESAYITTLRPGRMHWDDTRLALRHFFDSSPVPELKTLVEAVEGFRTYRSYNLFGLKRNGSLHSSDTYLSSSGDNAFTVLRNWRDRREHLPKYEFVLNGLCSAFPDMFIDLEFYTAGQTISVGIFQPGWKEALPLIFAPNGWLTGLLHLMAIAGGQPGSLVAIDEIENTLHPFAIRKLLESMDQWGEQQNLTVCLATHSPVLLDEFKREPESVFVMELEQEERPVPLTKLQDEEWLAQFSLGSLYAHGEFGSQRGEQARAT